MGVDVGLSRVERVNARRTAWIVLTAEVDIAMGIDGLQPDVFQCVYAVWTEEVIVPLLGICVDEDRVLWELVIEVNDIGQIRWSFAAA